MTENRGSAPTSTGADDRPYRAVLALTLLALVTGCSITSSDSHTVDITKHMRCVDAHDEAHGDGAGVVTVCDSYSPVPEATNG